MPQALQAFLTQYFGAAGSDLLPWQPTDFSDNPTLLATLPNATLRQWAQEVNGLWNILGRQVLVLTHCTHSHTHTHTHAHTRTHTHTGPTSASSTSIVGVALVRALPCAAHSKCAADCQRHTTLEDVLGRTCVPLLVFVALVQVAPDVYDNPQRHTLLPLPHPLIVPGGRFREGKAGNGCGMRACVRACVTTRHSWLLVRTRLLDVPCVTLVSRFVFLQGTTGTLRGL